VKIIAKNSQVEAVRIAAARLERVTF